MTVSTFKDMIRLVDVASHYASEYSEELSYTASDLESYYNDNKSSFNVASYESLYFKGTADSTTDADGNTVAPTDEENAAAKEKAIADADAALKLYQAGDPLETVSLAYESAAYSNTEAGSNSGDEASEWLFDESRADGDSTVITTDSGSRVLVFHSAGRQEYASRDVRHILFRADTTGLDSKSETYEADLQAAKDAAKAKAEDALAQWKAGDAGVVYGESSNYAGYHVMYFVGDDVPCWQVQVENTLRSRDTETWQKGLTDSAEVVELSGMKHVG